MSIKEKMYNSVSLIGRSKIGFEIRNRNEYRPAKPRLTKTDSSRNEKQGMVKENKNLSQYNKAELPNVAGKKFAIVTSEWNNHVTFNMRDGAKETLIDLGASEEDVKLYQVPGSFELVYGADKLAKAYPDLDGIIVIGCVIRGETAHFDYVCEGVTQGIKRIVW